MQAFCPKCKEEKEVIKESKTLNNTLYKLECNHTIIAKKEEEVEKKVVEEIEKEIESLASVSLDDAKSITLPKEIDPESFHNLKTKDVPYPFQELGIKFAIEHAFKVLIADEQGLGKTVQALGIIHYAMKHHYDEIFPVLILAKSNIKMQWLVQILNWCGIEYIPQVIEDGKSPPILGFNVYIASYDILRRFSKKEKIVLVSKWGHEIETTKKDNPFYDFPFKTVIMDEVQAIKGDSQRTEEVKRIAAGKNIIALSGTPIKNSAAEYYTILHLLNPNKFPTKEGYLRRWVKTEFVNGYEKYTGLKNPELFAEYTSDMIIRRTREQVKEEIGLRVTKANRIFYHVDFESEKLKAAYLAAEAEFIREMENETKRKDPIILIARLAVMRHLVGLNKIQPTVDLAIEFLLESPAGKLVIFTQHDDVMNAIDKLLAKWCMDSGYKPPLKFHSGLGSNERFSLVAKFAENLDIPFIIGSTLAMGEGTDRLQEVCNDCILAERQWNPANEEQAESRLVRIGQKKDFVNATYPIATGTIDEYFTEIVETKRRAMKEVLEGQTSEWDETGLLTALYETIQAKGRKKPVKGW
jgi:SWI/SNF-related matrix-associated actin-dependent regulator of chromatin subfamily A-like protein 1